MENTCGLAKLPYTNTGNIMGNLCGTNQLEIFYTDAFDAASSEPAENIAGNIRFQPVEATV